VSSWARDPVMYVSIRTPNADGGDVVDVSERVTQLTYEDHESKADKLTLTVDNYDLSNFDAPIWKTGNEIEVSWGYEGNVSPARQARITSVKGGLTLQVEALDPSSIMNKVTRVRTFEKMTRGEVAALIADEYGYPEDRHFVDDTEEVLEQIVQSGLTDAQFLRDLAMREGFVFFVDFDGFHFHERKTGQAPLRRLTYFTDPTEGEILSWTVDNDIYARKAGGVKVKGIDPLTKKPIEGTADNATTKDGAVAPTKVIITGISDRDGSPTGDLVKETGSAVEERTTEVTAKTAQRQADGIYKKNQMNAVELTLECRGDPQLVGKAVVEVAGIGSTISGNYYVTQVNHKVGSGYTMTIKAKRDGKTSGTNAAARGEAAGSASGDGSGVPSGGSPNTSGAPEGGPGNGAAGDALVTKIDPRTGAVSFVETRGRSQAAGGAPPGERGRLPGRPEER
jgi:phage protein D